MVTSMPRNKCARRGAEMEHEGQKRYREGGRSRNPLLELHPPKAFHGVVVRLRELMFVDNPVW
jgi:hypothetical protein